MKTTVTLCDFKCRTLADGTCACCQRDACEAHLKCRFVVAFENYDTEKDKNGNATAGTRRREVLVRVCPECNDDAAFKTWLVDCRDKLQATLDDIIIDLRTARAAAALKTTDKKETTT